MPTELFTITRDTQERFTEDVNAYLKACAAEGVTVLSTTFTASPYTYTRYVEDQIIDTDTRYIAFIVTTEKE